MFFTDAYVRFNNGAIVCLRSKSMTKIMQVQDTRVCKVEVIMGELQAWVTGKVAILRYPTKAGKNNIRKNSLKECYATFYTKP